MPTIERIIPVLTYADIAAGHDFLVNVLGFESGGVDCDRSGVPIHAEVRGGGQAIWLHASRTSTPWLRRSPRPRPTGWW